jgi:hypothetical protein
MAHKLIDALSPAAQMGCRETEIHGNLGRVSCSGTGEGL